MSKKNKKKNKQQTNKQKQNQPESNPTKIEPTKVEQTDTKINEKQVLVQQNLNIPNTLTKDQINSTVQLIESVMMPKDEFEKILFMNSKLKMENQELQKEKAHLMNSLINCQSLLEQATKDSNLKIEKLQKENEKLQKENEILREEISSLKEELKELKDEMKIIKEREQYKHKAALLGQLALGTEKLLLKHVYGNSDRSTLLKKYSDLLS